MIVLDDPRRPVPAAAIKTPGGFAWWYFEVFDDHGNGAVIIASFGLPFLPGIASSARAGRPVVPAHRPALNIVGYKAGREDWYQLQEIDPSDVDGGTEGPWRFGRTTVTLARGRAMIDVDLDLPTDGSRLRGTVEIAGVPTTRARPFAVGDAPHAWTPLLAAARGRVDLRADSGYALKVDGRAYVDRNWSTAPLHDLGIDVWTWGYAPTTDGARIFYVLDGASGAPPRAFGVEALGDGVVDAIELEVVRSRRRRSAFGMPWWQAVSLARRGQPWLDVALEQRMDDGPFYLRYRTRCEVDGLASHGSAEVIVPGRVDLARHRALVNMRVGHGDGADSPFHALFCGPRAGRFGRLLRSTPDASPARAPESEP